MVETTLTSRVFNQHVSRAKRAAAMGPVVITERGKPAYVLLRHDEFRKLAGKRQSLRDLLVMNDADDIDFDPPKADIVLKVPDLG